MPFDQSSQASVCAPPLIVNGRFLAQPLSGVQRFATELSRALAEHTELGVLTPPNAAPNQLPARAVGKRSGQLWEQFDLPLHIRQAILLNPGNTAPLALRRQIVVIHDAGPASTPEAYRWPFRVWYRVLHRILAARRVPVCTVSNFARADILRHLPFDPALIKVIPEGADHIGRATPARGPLAKLGLEKNGFVLAVGNLAAHKNLSVLGRLAEQLAARGLCLAITGALKGSAFRRGDAARLPQPATYLGRVDDDVLRALYEDAACFVMPSRYEGFGLPAIEAMYCGCPVVAADIPALRETCGGAALFADPADPGAFVSQVFAVLDDPARAARLRAAAIAHARPMTWTRAAESLLAAVAAWDQDWPASSGSRKRSQARLAARQPASPSLARPAGSAASRRSATTAAS